MRKNGFKKDFPAFPPAPPLGLAKYIYSIKFLFKPNTSEQNGSSNIDFDRSN